MKSLFEFKPNGEIDKAFPKDIIEHQCNELAQITENLVIGRVREYDGPIEDYVTGLSAIAKPLTDTLGKKYVSIQTDLGEQSGNEFTYEFFISSRHTTNYVYRVFFIRYGISVYPTKLVLDETIATQIALPSCNVTCQNEDEFNNLLSMILNSPKIKEVVNNLFAMNIKFEKQLNTDEV